MKGLQRRIIQTTTNSNTSLNNVIADELVYDVTEDAVQNIHGLRYCFSVEPEDADANCNGWWMLLCLPSDVMPTSVLPNTIGELGAGDINPYVWGLGCFTASNQAPYHMEFTPSTSRTCQKGARLYACMVKEGISAGAVRCIQTMTFFTSR